MNRFSYYVEYVNNSVAPRRVRKSRIDWRAVLTCGFLVVAALLHFGSRAV
jgi:hypothetical protein